MNLDIKLFWHETGILSDNILCCILHPELLNLNYDLYGNGGVEFVSSGASKNKCLHVVKM